MADDNIVRSYRSNDATRRMNAPPREAAPRDVGGNDPLAELARLIGQNDPFAELERNAAPDPRAEAPASDWRATAAALARESMRNAAVEQQTYPDPHYADQQYTDHRYTDQRYTDQQYADQHQQYADQQYAGQPHGEQRYADPHYPDTQYATQQDAGPHYEDVESAIAAAKSLRASPGDRFGHYAPEPPAHDQRSHAGYADNPYDDAPRAAGGGDSYDMRQGARRDDARRADPQPHAADGENYFFDGAPQPADQRFYDDPPRAHASNSLLTIAVLVGCGILGTAGAYGYRTYYSGPHAGDAPIIAPDKNPIKIVPAQAGNDGSKSTAAGDGGSGERVVTRQEEPITLSDPGGAGSPSNPRVVLPAPFTPNPAPPPPVQAATATPAGVGNEPKKVRTVAIRPEGAVDPMAPAPPTAGARQASTKPAPQQAVARGGAGPLSIDPQAQPSDQASPPAPRASGPAPAAPPPPAQHLASVSNTATGGGYVVQISSQRSEADAQASFHSLQAKYPSQLGDRESIVRRADLGAKGGVVYRAMVGPFGTAGDAGQFCSDLKAAGGDCLVLKN